MRARQILALAAALALPGCYTVACVEQDPVLLGEVCREHGEWVFADPPGNGPLDCQGQETPGRCAHQGFTVACDSYWLKPGNTCQ